MTTKQDVINQDQDMIPGSKQPIAMLGGWNDPPATLFHQNSSNSLKRLDDNCGGGELLNEEKNNQKTKNINEIMKELNGKLSSVSNPTAEQFIKTKLSKIEEDWRNKKFNDDIKLHLSLFVDSLNESNWSEAFQQIQELSKYQDIVKNWLLALRKLKTELNK
ncbi:hypothetical protein SNEBB_002645 [Seison nebaliae]|nr:hypothetical protein SNEBB_002645 [Seison nebaliae]